MRITPLVFLLCLAPGIVFSDTLSKNVPAQNSVVEALVLPNENEATSAIVKMLDLADMQSEITVKLGTCISAVNAQHVGQVACTVAVKLGAGTSETQADFYRNGAAWEAEPSTSQDSLPFPDPAL